MLIPNLGECLLGMELLTVENLQRAIEYQEKKAALGQPRSLGKVLIELGMLDRETIDKIITEQIILLHEAELNKLHRSLEAYRQEVDGLMLMVVEISKSLNESKTIEELLDLLTQSCVKQLGCVYAQVQLVDLGGDITHTVSYGSFDLASQTNTGGTDVVSSLMLPLEIDQSSIGEMHIILSPNGISDETRISTFRCITQSCAVAIQQLQVLEGHLQNQLAHEINPDSSPIDQNSSTDASVLQEIVYQLHSTRDVQAILDITTQELSKVLNAHHVKVELFVSDEEHVDSGSGQTG